MTGSVIWSCGDGSANCYTLVTYLHTYLPCPYLTEMPIKEVYLKLYNVITSTTCIFIQVSKMQKYFIANVIYHKLAPVDIF